MDEIHGSARRVCIREVCNKGGFRAPPQKLGFSWTQRAQRATHTSSPRTVTPGCHSGQGFRASHSLTQSMTVSWTQGESEGGGPRGEQERVRGPQRPWPGGRTPSSGSPPSPPTISSRTTAQSRAVGMCTHGSQSPCFPLKSPFTLEVFRNRKGIAVWTPCSLSARKRGFSFHEEVA